MFLVTTVIPWIKAVAPINALAHQSHQAEVARRLALAGGQQRREFGLRIGAGDIKVFGVEKEKVAGLATFVLPDARAPKRKSEIPAGLAISRERSSCSKAKAFSPLWNASSP